MESWCNSYLVELWINLIHSNDVWSRKEKGKKVFTIQRRNGKKYKRKYRNIQNYLLVSQFEVKESTERIEKQEKVQWCVEGEIDGVEMNN